MKVPLMQNLQTAATVLTHRLPHSAKPRSRILPQRGMDMNGVDKIIEDIRSESEQTVNAVRKDASDKRDAILAAARTKAEAEAARIRSEGSKKAADIRARSGSAAELRRRQRILYCKQELIAETLDRVLEAAEKLPEERYFDALLHMAAENAHPGEQGVMKLGSRDLGRLPADFEQKLAGALPTGTTLTLSREPAELSDGFLLLYGGIEENCSFRAVLSARKEEMQDKVCGILFG